MVPEQSPPSSALVAMIGAGQLARMTHQAAISMGVRLRVLAASPADSAVLAGAEAVLGHQDRLDDLTAFAAGADVVTFENENIDPGHLRAMADGGLRLSPVPEAKLLAQDKLAARRRLRELGHPVPPFAHARSADEIQRFADEHGWPVVAKPPRGGYDGRGVLFARDRSEAERLAGEYPDGLLLEPALHIDRELAVLVARGADGRCATYPVVESVMREAMCREVLVPAPIEPELATAARALAGQIAEDIGATGIMAVELFVCAGELLINELALRPHNSGHFTIEGCTTSQFEQHLRAVLGWPLGPAALHAPAVVMVNVIGTSAGDPLRRVPLALAVPGAHVHLYAKEHRTGRKLGHVTALGDDLTTAREIARRAAALLSGESA